MYHQIEQIVGKGIAQIFYLFMWEKVQNHLKRNKEFCTFLFKFYTQSFVMCVCIKINMKLEGLLQKYYGSVLTIVWEPKNYIWNIMFNEWFQFSIYFPPWRPESQQQFKPPHCLIKQKLWLLKTSLLAYCISFFIK